MPGASNCTEILIEETIRSVSVVDRGPSGWDKTLWFVPRLPPLLVLLLLLGRGLALLRSGAEWAEARGLSSAAISRHCFGLALGLTALAAGSQDSSAILGWLGDRPTGPPRPRRGNCRVYRACRSG
ncbi:hypothetical protein RA2_01207 [Roseovarius sp. A-2]|uniref:hypothetical protein n=1 Tax=Roseovarius sp. A-2 TaxID=1570360 RepID=UPI0009B54FE2|nr:hypothetical protein [Roseovarius sp. A-2]GAW34162.1 hypothetical protein RA2_01207 [Roseovarius sp. A-2]